LLDLITDALEYGLAADAVKYSDALLAEYQKKPNPTARFTPAAEKFAQIYEKLQPQLKGGARQRADVEDWRVRLEAADALTQGHYTLIYWDSGRPELTRRFAQLEDNFRAFFLWHATRGVALPVPERPLAAVLPPDGAKVYPMYKG